MLDFQLTFWSGWVAGITLLGLGGLAWLALGVWRAPSGVAAPPDQTWDDDLREGDDAPPKWWFFGLFAALIFSCAYLVLYPGLGVHDGALGWSQHRQFAAGDAHHAARHADARRRWLHAPLAELRADSSAMASARRLFANHCAACHGDDARGQAGLFPNLTDDQWQWGGGGERIMQTLMDGRVAAMPPLGASLSGVEIARVADYVLALNAGDAEQPGRQLYAANCAACHGANGEGNALIGAPAFRDHKWTYLRAGGDPRAAVIATITDGRQGVMPAQKNRLHPEQIRLLTAWLTGGIDTAPPAK